MERVCENVIRELYSLSADELSEETKQHLTSCETCRKAFESRKKTDELVASSIPETPDLKERVMARIDTENIPVGTEETSKPRRFIPFGTIGAAAAILVVCVSVYGSKIPGMLKGMNRTDSAEMEACDEEAPEMSPQKAESESTAAFGNTLIAGNANIAGHTSIANNAGESFDMEVSEEEGGVYDYSALMDGYTAIYDPSETIKTGRHQNDNSEPETTVEEGHEHEEALANTVVNVTLQPDSTVRTGDGTFNNPLPTGGTPANAGKQSGASSGRLSEKAAQKPAATGSGVGDNDFDAGFFDIPLEEAADDNVPLIPENNFLFNMTAEEVYDYFEGICPGRISREAFLEAGDEAYHAFAHTVADPEIDYTEENLRQYRTKKQKRIVL